MNIVLFNYLTKSEDFISKFPIELAIYIYNQNSGFIDKPSSWFIKRL